MGMAVRLSQITKEIVKLISRPDVVGLATHRHLPHERAIYLRHGKCGFAVDVVVEENGVKKLHAILVEAEAKPKKKRWRSWMELGGTVTYILSEKLEDGFKVKRRRAKYRNGEHLFRQVEAVRAAFYEKYRELKAREEVRPVKIEEEVFHMVGMEERDLFLGV